MTDDSYTYNQAERLTHLVANGDATDYVHDAFGRRVMKSLASGGGSIYTFDTDGKMLNENHFPPAGQPGQVILDYLYLDDGRLIGVMSDKVSQLYAVHADRWARPKR